MISQKNRAKMDARPHQLSDRDKVLIGNGGLGHRVLRGPASRGYRQTPPKRRFTRQEKKEQK
jgi:hypothetical protein